MLTGPRISICFIILSRVLFLICRGEKYTQYYTILYNVQKLICGLSNVKTLTWGGGLQCKDVSFPPLMFYAVIQMPNFPQAAGPTPIPWSCPSTPHAHTCDTIGRRRCQNIGNRPFPECYYFFSLHQFFAFISATSAFIFGPCVYSFALFACMLSFWLQCSLYLSSSTNFSFGFPPFFSSPLFPITTEGGQWK